MKQALYWKKLKKKIIQCQLCPHFCIIKPGEVGKCKVRKNINGKLYSLVYGKPCSFNLDPIEKKPLYHFLPGQQAISIATPGCNLNCLHCQNYEISQAKPEEISSLNLMPKQIIEKTKQRAKIISYTYTEPTIFYEYMLDISKLAKKEKIKNTIVSNGFINPKPLNQLCKYIDGANIDLKSINPEHYKKICQARLEPVLEAIKILHEKKVWLELTNLIIPSLNDSLAEIKKLIRWIKDNLGLDVPLHFTAFYPTYKLMNLPPTSIEILRKARQEAKKAGLHYVYTGNLPDEEGSTTFCPKCNQPAIKRDGFFVIYNNLKNGRCKCGEKIAGVWR